MCGIVGYVGGRQAYPILIKGLTRLEYRGYDSAGVALINDGGDLVGIEIAACGDESLDAVAKALRFAKETIDDQRFGNNK